MPSHLYGINLMECKKLTTTGILPKDSRWVLSSTVSFPGVWEHTADINRLSLLMFGSQGTANRNLTWYKMLGTENLWRMYVYQYTGNFTKLLFIILQHIYLFQQNLSSWKITLILFFACCLNKWLIYSDIHILEGQCFCSVQKKVHCTDFILFRFVQWIRL